MKQKYQRANEPSWQIQERNKNPVVRQNPQFICRSQLTDTDQSTMTKVLGQKLTTTTMLHVKYDTLMQPRMKPYR